MVMSSDPIYETYKRFQHMDRFLTDPGYHSDDPQYQMLRACWQAIKDDLRKRGCAAVIREEDVNNE
jgi:hypothetical protein